MTTAVVDPVQREPEPRPSTIGAAWPLLLGLIVLALPTAYNLANQAWNTESGAHGPIIIATGLWLLHRQLPVLRAEGRRGSLVLTVLMLAPSLALYAFGRAYDFLTFEAAGLYGVGIAFFHHLVGWRMLVRQWFPILYLGFAVPPPNFLLDALTAPLKTMVSTLATNILSFFGFPISRQGVVLYIAQYQLLVEDACSGMNSLVGLTAISLFYIYIMRRTTWLYAAVLTALVIPIAILANVVRIMALVLITYFLGDKVGQSFVHGAAGVFLFAVALLLVFGVDSLLQVAARSFKTRTAS
jgi:exosortase B